jgi:ribose transport system substrate-binding protein
VAFGLSLEGQVHQMKGALDAGKAIGWTMIPIDGQLSPAKMLSGCEALLQRGVQGIVLLTVDASLVGDCVAKARAAGIPFVESMGADPVPQGGLGVVLNDPIAGGKALAAAVAVDSGGKGSIALWDNTETSLIKRRIQGFKEGLQEFAPHMTTLDAGTLVGADLGPPAQQKMQALLESHPRGTLNYVFCFASAYCSPLVQEAQSLNRTDVKFVSFDVGAQLLKWLRAGNQLLYATDATPLEWDSWAAIDQLNRAFEKAPMASWEYVPSRILTPKSAPAGTDWEGDFNYQTEYEKLWGKG